MCSTHIVSLPLSASDQGIKSQGNVYWFIGVDHCQLKQQERRWPRAHKSNEGVIFRGERILRSPKPHHQHRHQPSTATDLIYTQLASSKSSNRATSCWMGCLVGLQVITKTVLMVTIRWALSVGVFTWGTNSSTREGVGKVQDEPLKASDEIRLLINAISTIRRGSC